MTHLTPSKWHVDKVQLVKKRVRFVVVKGVKYLRADDVTEFVRELGATEETDVRNRLEDAAESLGR